MVSDTPFAYLISKPPLIQINLYLSKQSESQRNSVLLRHHFEFHLGFQVSHGFVMIAYV